MESRRQQCSRLLEIYYDGTCFSAWPRSKARTRPSCRSSPGTRAPASLSASTRTSTCISGAWPWPPCSRPSTRTEVSGVESASAGTIVESFLNPRSGQGKSPNRFTSSSFWGMIRAKTATRCLFHAIWRTVLPFDLPAATFRKASFTSSSPKTSSTEASMRLSPNISGTFCNPGPSSCTKTKR